MATVPRSGALRDFVEFGQSDLFKLGDKLLAKGMMAIIEELQAIREILDEGQRPERAERARQGFSTDSGEAYAAFAQRLADESERPQD